MNQQEFPPPPPSQSSSESFDNYHSFGSNSAAWQDSTSIPRFRPQGHYQGAFYN